MNINDLQVLGAYVVGGQVDIRVDERNTNIGRCTGDGEVELTESGRLLVDRLKSEREVDQALTAPPRKTAKRKPASPLDDLDSLLE